MGWYVAVLNRRPLQVGSFGRKPVRIGWVRSPPFRWLPLSWLLPEVDGYLSFPFLITMKGHIRRPDLGTEFKLPEALTRLPTFIQKSFEKRVRSLIKLRSRDVADDGKGRTPLESRPRPAQ